MQSESWATGELVVRAAAARAVPGEGASAGMEGDVDAWGVEEIVAAAASETA